MAVPNINGGWLSEIGKIIYTITQIDDKFVWRTVHPTGVTETGIGWFPNANEEGISTAVEGSGTFMAGI